ncbi:hypothetical protein DFH08DRAFT_1085620 [Mycena albidolilacea]|uniref:Uncharacterized protein n=1 Tax=Mycena albidolilacea TaxID=1033008 RepID=A0AAD6ZHK4_9AGAR|nr:hypothetical protein DFH08DRAFT_1085620 [Mycena albidolilacea]
MRSVPLFILSFVFAVVADRNVTIDDTDASIQYSDGGHSLPCAFDAGGNFVGGQPGCFLNGPKDSQNCSSGAHILQKQTSTLSMQFKGSAIYMNVLLDDISNIYTVTLDGKSTDIDGVRPGGALLCYTFFSQSNLDPTIEHNISVSIKGLSPARNLTIDNDGTFFFWLDNFVVTTPDGNSTSASSAGGSGTAASPSGTASGSSPSASSTGTGGALKQMVALSWISFGFGAVSTLFLLW